MSIVQIKYKSEEYIVEAEGGNLLDHIRKAGIPIGAPCGGKGSCKKCMVTIVNPNDRDKTEKVLACDVVIEDNILVEVPSPPEARILSESYWPALNIQWNKLNKQASFGVAVDIGTTTVVVFMEDLNLHKNIGTYTFLNPQGSYGADVISRIQAVMQQPETLAEQKNLIVGAINEAIHSLSAKHKITGDSIVKVSISGNNPMLHLLAGSNPSGLAIYPFNPVFTDEQIINGGDLGLTYCKDADINLLPSLSAYVGADIIAGMAATELPDEDIYSLYLDIGTNGEMALGNRNRILTCATAAGPAFEGAKISCGLGGVQGAIHKFSKGEFETIGATPPIGLCGSGLVDVIAWMLDQDKLDATGYIEEPVTFLEADELQGRSALQLTPMDIREVQLAKGAIAAGIQTLISEAGIDVSQVERLFLAGGFGYALHVESAVRIGLIPESLKDKVIRAGNLAGLGARLALHSEEFKIRVNNIRNKAEYFELSNHPGFNEAFVMEMGF